ncbi:glycoside hydrolase family 97 protein [uncultured Chitinophaga sp.]|jgi:Glycoside hydrolase 97.|uniref:glycoside hydrolase family 97 protein n=1 Tax=uncultured Chitinophaga sp. TaxID=339340 RepID=UPI0026292431|nr:glycoside hydrolase family 97 protein [uncultured Chitinophaga sp.]
MTQNKALTALLVWICCLLPLISFSQSSILLSSPGNQLAIEINTKDSLSWTLRKGNETLVSRALAGLDFEGKSYIGFNERVKSIDKVSKDDIIHPTVAVRQQTIRDVYNELKINFRSGNAIIFRAYNNGVAYRWITHFRDSVNVKNEIVDYAFPDNNRVFWGTEENKQFLSHFELLFRDTTMASFSKEQHCGLPLYVSAASGTKMLFTEADLLDYSNLFFFGTGASKITSGFPKVILKESLIRDRGTKIEETADYIARTSGSRSFPWRVIMVANKDMDLLENNLVFQLASPNVLKDTDWIQPGKVSWDWWNANNIYGVDFRAGINNQTYKYYIDFAARFGLQYVILDEGWTKTTWDITHPGDAIDVPELAAYGKAKNVGIILWTLWQPMDKDMENVLSTYEKWGVKGVKVDFMARADQYMVNFYERLSANAAKHHLLVDLHGAYKPVGLERKYPNIISYEGVRGLENYKWSDDEATPPHEVTLPFTRMVLGPMDFTPGAMRNATKKDFHINFDAPMSQGTRAHHVAMYAVYESPLQMLADNPSNYLRDTVCTRYIASFPTTWDTTVALDGKIKEYVAVARKKGNRWFIGAMTNWNPRELTLHLHFLDPNKRYKVRMLADGINADRFAEDYKISEATWVKGQEVLVGMQPGGGWSAILTEE